MLEIFGASIFGGGDLVLYTINKNKINYYRLVFIVRMVSQSLKLVLVLIFKPAYILGYI